MENTNSMQPVQLAGLLAHWIEMNRDDLVVRYLSVLRESLFSNRAELRPSALKQVAADEAEALLNYLRQSGASATERGEQLHQAGFNAGAVLRLHQVTRQFLLNHPENGQIAPMLEIVGAYELAVVEGFIQSIDNTNKIERGELERMLIALHRRGNN